MKISAGTDLVLISRIADLQAKPEFLTRVFTPAELAECGSDASRLAGRWAAKESTMKALGRGLDQLDLRMIEVRTDRFGAPTLALTGAALAASQQAGWQSWSVSISHEGDYATAVVVALAR